MSNGLVGPELRRQAWPPGNGPTACAAQRQGSRRTQKVLDIPVKKKKEFWTHVLKCISLTHFFVANNAPKAPVPKLVLVSAPASNENTVTSYKLAHKLR